MHLIAEVIRRSVGWDMWIEVRVYVEYAHIDEINKSRWYRQIIWAEPAGIQG